MHQVSLSEFNMAVKCFDLLSLTSKKDVRKKYLKLSRQYHPDIEGGSIEKFQEIRESYDILVQYMENFRFIFNENEFKQQHPILVNLDQNWLK